MKNRKGKLLIETFLAMLLSLSLVFAAPPPQTEVRQTLAMSFPEGPTISLKFGGTYRLPRASGEAKVERNKGMTEVEIELDEMKPASLFGGQYNTYVLWAASPEGHVDNLGEFVLEGNRSKLNVSTPLETFGLFVSAEPHFLVDTPSRFVVLENTRPTKDIAPLKVSEIQYEGFEGTYRYERESLSNMPEAKGEVRPHVEAAHTAVELARDAGAEKFAPEELARATKALEQAQATAVSQGSSNQMLAGHEAIRLAVEAEKLAKKRSFEAALEQEREERASQIANLKSSIEAAQSEAERAKLEAEQRELQAEIEAQARKRAQEQAEELAREKVRAEAEARQAKQRAQKAEVEAASAKKQQAQTREHLETVMGELVDIRQGARGLIVSMPDILFDFDKATLKPEARELLSRMAGVLLVTKDYDLLVEGHTDSIGSDSYNMELSNARAQAVREYLVEAGVDSSNVTAEGFGESQPIASNDTADGREKNRRVEIVIANDTAGDVQASLSNQ